jgi:hypothetical protein
VAVGVLHAQQHQATGVRKTAAWWSPRSVNTAARVSMASRPGTLELFVSHLAATLATAELLSTRV